MSIQRNGYCSVAMRRFKDFNKITDEKVYDDWKSIIYMKKNLLTNVGKDAIHALAYINDNGSSPTRGFGVIALTTAVITPAITDTVLTSEIITGGLQRVDAITKTHISASNSSLIEHTFTSDTVFTGVRACALFNSLAGATMGHITTFTAQNLAAFDQIKVSYTINLA